VRWIGVSNFNVKQLKRALTIAPITSLQPPYSLLARQVEEELFPFAKANNIGVISYSPMRAGLLTGKMTKQRALGLGSDDWRSRDKDFQEPNLSRNLELAELLREIGARHGHTPGEVALAWVLREPAITGAIVGLRKPDQVRGTLGALTFRLDANEISEIEYFMKHRMQAASV
jgi:aryl-alcohol dehydrogenase-like predicted oxidoreductase